MRNAIAFLVLLCAIVIVAGEEYERFHGQKVVRASLTSEEHTMLVERMNLDVWSRDGFAVIADDNDVRVTDDDLEEFKKMGIAYSVLIEDVEQHLQMGRDEAARTRSAASPFHNAYHTYPEIIAFITNLTNTFPRLAKVVPSIGKSIEGRDIIAVEITGGKAPTKSLFISGGQHAREWISPATVVYIFDQLLSLYGTDTATTTLVDTFSIYIVPVVNPDGYAFTQTGNRLWRKNRRVNTGGTYGVDLNRNWDEHWCQYGASKTPSSDTYCGTAPFSEPETKATSAYILQHKHAALIDFHSYGQLVLRPYGWTVSPPPTEALLKSVGDGIASAILSHGGKTYTSEHGADLYPASGAADDWGFTKANIPLVYTIELRDTGSSGFQLPANQIVPTGVEAYAAFQYLSTRA